MPNDNGKKPPPPDSLPFERRPLTCKGCNHVFKEFVLEQIDDLMQLRCGDALISRAEIVCLHCGRMVYWVMKEKDLEKMAVRYGELTAVIKGYNPE